MLFKLNWEARGEVVFPTQPKYSEGTACASAITGSRSNKLDQVRECRVGHASVIVALQLDELHIRMASDPEHSPKIGCFLIAAQQFQLPIPGDQKHWRCIPSNVRVSPSARGAGGLHRQGARETIAIVATKYTHRVGRLANATLPSKERERIDRRSLPHVLPFFASALIWMHRILQARSGILLETYYGVPRIEGMRIVSDVRRLRIKYYHCQPKRGARSTPTARHARPQRIGVCVEGNTGTWPCGIVGLRSERARISLDHRHGGRRYDS
jgi:hypothetical protein